MALILAIEDDNVVSMLIAATLKKHRIVMASDGASGMRMAHDLNPDAVLLDVGMPDINGLEICEAIRRDPVTMNTPIMLVTAWTDVVVDESRWRALGANAALAKPFSPAKLNAMVDKLLVD